MYNQLPLPPFIEVREAGNENMCSLNGYFIPPIGTWITFNDIEYIVKKIKYNINKNKITILVDKL